MYCTPVVLIAEPIISCRSACHCGGRVLATLKYIQSVGNSIAVIQLALLLARSRTQLLLAYKAAVQRGLIGGEGWQWRVCYLSVVACLPSWQLFFCWFCCFRFAICCCQRVTKVNSVPHCFFFIVVFYISLLSFNITCFYLRENLRSIAVLAVICNFSTIFSWLKYNKTNKVLSSFVALFCCILLKSGLFSHSAFAWVMNVIQRILKSSSTVVSYSHFVYRCPLVAIVLSGTFP